MNILRWGIWLSFQGLSSLPNSIYQLSNLKRLSISGERELDVFNRSSSFSIPNKSSASTANPRKTFVRFYPEPESERLACIQNLFEYHDELRVISDLDGAFTPPTYQGNLSNAIKQEGEEISFSETSRGCPQSCSRFFFTDVALAHGIGYSP